jgi:hypothetical protein
MAMTLYIIRCVEYRYPDGSEALDIFVTERDGTKHHFYVGVSPEYKPRIDAEEVKDAT